MGNKETQITSPEVKREALRELLEEGNFLVSAEHFREIARVSWDLSQDTNDLVVFRTLSEISGNLDGHWCEWPVSAEAAKLMKTSLRLEMLELVEAVDSQDPAEVLTHLKKLYLAYDQCLLNLNPL